MHKLNKNGTRATRYQTGHFLAPHDDKPQGDIAIIHYLTKNWQPAYGGNLQILERDAKTIRRLVIPGYNTFTMLNVEHAKSRHCVTHIAPFVKRSRYALSSWLVPDTVNEKITCGTEDEGR